MNDSVKAIGELDTEIWNHDQIRVRSRDKFSADRPREIGRSDEGAFRKFDC